MAVDFFTVTIDNSPVQFEKKRLLSIEPYESGARLYMEASHVDEEPLMITLSMSYADVLRSFAT